MATKKCVRIRRPVGPYPNPIQLFSTGSYPGRCPCIYAPEAEYVNGGIDIPPPLLQTISKNFFHLIERKDP